jgi:MFS family permease
VRHRQPLGLLNVTGDIGEPLARMAGLEGLTRAIMIGSVPLAALKALGSTLAVSVAFAIGSGATVLVTLNVARLERHVARRWILSGGIVSVFLAAGLFAFGPKWTIPLAIAMRSAHASVFSVCLSLYIMDFIGKRDMTRIEARRSVYLAGAWLIGPTLGTWMFGSLGTSAPFLASMVLSTLLMVYHWRLRFLRNPVLRGPIHPAPSPLEAIPRFFGQRYLRASYVITSIRSIFWSALFVYGPIYVVDAGLSPWVAGVFLSVASSVLFAGPLVRRWSDRNGVRQVMLAGFALPAVSLAALALLGDPRPIGLAFWLVGAVGAGALDVLANIPFMRLVKPRERPAMTTVFSTWRELSFFITPGIAAIVLLLGPLRMLYAVLAVLMVGGAVATLSLPRRL